MPERRGRRWFRGFGWGLAAVLALAAILTLFAFTMFFTPKRLVALLERRFNCRASVEAVELQWLGNPSRLEIRGLKLYPRDAFAEGLSSDSPRTSVAPLVTAEQLRLDVAFGSLLVGKIDIRELSGTGVRAVATELESGDSDLELLFADPDELEDKIDADAADERKKRGDHDFTVDTLPLPAHCRSARLEDFELSLVLPRRRVRVDFEGISLSLTDVDVSRRDLEHHNHAKLRAGGKVTVSNTETSKSYGTAILRGFGDVTPFDAASRLFMPEVHFQVDVLEGSHADAVPLLEKVSSKLKALEDYGIALGDLRLKGDLEKEALVRARYKDEVFTLTSDSEFRFADFLLSLKEGSWYNADDDQHRFETGVRASERVTGAALSRVGRFVEEKLKLPPEPFQELIAQHLLEDGRLYLRFNSEGDLGSPDVSLATELPSLSDILKKLSRDPFSLIRSLLD